MLFLNEYKTFYKILCTLCKVYFVKIEHSTRTVDELSICMRYSWIPFFPVRKSKFNWIIRCTLFTRMFHYSTCHAVKLIDRDNHLKHFKAKYYLEIQSNPLHMHNNVRSANLVSNIVRCKVSSLFICSQIRLLLMSCDFFSFV